MANEKRNDLISRSALIAEYDRVHIGEPGKARKLMEDAPTVDAVEVVHGRWIPTYKVDWWMGTQDIDGFTCNQCARHFKSKLRLNYCPNCGAKMDGERKDNEI